MPVDKMSSRERWLAVLRRESPDRLPMDYWATPEATQAVMQYLGCADQWEMFDRLHIDPVVTVAPEYVGPPILEGYDMFGCGYQYVDYGTGVYEECVEHPLAGYETVEEVERNYVWPTPDWFDYSVIPGQVRGKERYPLRGGGSEPFYRYTYLRGHRQAYADLVARPEFVHYCLGRLFDFCYEDTRRIYEQIPGQVTFSYIAEDLGSQENLLFSPTMIREYFLPGMRRMVELAHEAGVYAFTHSDGAIRQIIPDLVAIGVDILNPIQWRCKGMHREELKRAFGESLVFHGAMDNQHTLVFGNVEDVRAEVADNIRILGQDGGYILAPCHNLQAVSPPENILAMYDAGFEYGQL